MVSYVEQMNQVREQIESLRSSEAMQMMLHALWRETPPQHETELQRVKKEIEKI